MKVLPAGYSGLMQILPRREAANIEAASLAYQKLYQLIKSTLNLSHLRPMHQYLDAKQ